MTAPAIARRPAHVIAAARPAAADAPPRDPAFDRLVARVVARLARTSRPMPPRALEALALEIIADAANFALEWAGE